MYDDICFFVKIIECGKFSSAAEKFNLAQSTISRKISALEEQLNCRLIKRDSRNLELTEVGQNLYNEFKDTATEVDKLVSSVLIKDSRYNNILNLLLPVGMANFAFSRTLANLSSKLSGIQLNLTYYAGTINIDNYDYDIAIISSANKNLAQTSKLVYRSKVIIACSPEYIKNHGLCTSLKELREHTVIGNIRVLLENSCTNLFHEEDNSVVPLDIDYKLYLNSFIEAKHLTLSGVTISGLMENDIKTELARGDLIRVLPDYHVGYMNYYLISKFETTDFRYHEVLEVLEDFFKQSEANQELS